MSSPVPGEMHCREAAGEATGGRGGQVGGKNSISSVNVQTAGHTLNFVINLSVFCVNHVNV